MRCHIVEKKDKFMIRVRTTIITTKKMMVLRKSAPNPLVNYKDSSRQSVKWNDVTGHAKVVLKFRQFFANPNSYEAGTLPEGN